MEGIEFEEETSQGRPLWVDGYCTAGRLSEKIMRNILSRLPVKSLVRFKCVSKSWLRLIKSPEFAHYHYAARSSLLGDAFDYLLIVNRVNWVTSRFSFVSYDTLQLDVKDPLSLPVFECKPFPPLENEDHGNISCGIIGSCNGIFCLQIYVGSSWFPPVLLWNPATRETRALRYIPRDLEQLGFGFDSETGDYKVVCTHDKLFERGNSHLVEVYSLNSDSWRTLDASYFFDGTRSFNPIGFGCSSNGRMFNWIGRDVGSSRHQYLITFDMSDEVFIQTPLPGKYNSYNFQQSNSSQPCVFCYTSGYDFLLETVDFWVLDSDYGPNSSWTMLRSVTLLDESIQSCVMLGSWKNKELLFQKDRMLVSYDPDSEHIRFSGIEGNFSSIGLGYTPSMVSVKRKGCRGEDVNLALTSDTIEFLSLGKVEEKEQANLFKFEIDFSPEFLPYLGDNIVLPNLGDYIVMWSEDDGEEEENEDDGEDDDHGGNNDMFRNGDNIDVDNGTDDSSLSEIIDEIGNCSCDPYNESPSRDNDDGDGRLNNYDNLDDDSDSGSLSQVYDVYNESTDRENDDYGDDHANCDNTDDGNANCSLSQSSDGANDFSYDTCSESINKNSDDDGDDRVDNNYDNIDDNSCKDNLSHIRDDDIDDHNSDGYHESANADSDDDDDDHDNNGSLFKNSGGIYYGSGDDNLFQNSDDMGDGSGNGCGEFAYREWYNDEDHRVGDGSLFLCSDVRNYGSNDDLLQNWDAVGDSSGEFVNMDIDDFSS